MDESAEVSMASKVAKLTPNSLAAFSRYRGVYVLLRYLMAANLVINGRMETLFVRPI